MSHGDLMETASSIADDLTVSRIGAEGKSQAQALLATLATLKSQEAQLEDKVKERDREAKVIQDRKDKVKLLRAETAEHNRKALEATEFIKMAREVVNTFPGDTQILRLERRVESLQNDIKDADRTLKQRRTGVEAYQTKIKALQQGKSRLLGDVSSLVSDVVSQVEGEAQLHAGVSTVKPLAAVDVLTDICKDREQELETINQQLEEKVKKDSDLTSQVQQLTDMVQETIPRVEADKNNDIEEILTEWEVEKRHLLNIYGKLCVINREQNYHLQRGTHIKRAPTKSAVDPNDTKLNLDNTELAREINSLKDKNKIAEEDVAALQTQLQQLKRQRLAEGHEFQEAKTEAEERVKEAVESRRDLQSENSELRRMKGELLELLQCLRENQTAIQRAALMGHTPQLVIEAPPGNIEN